MTRDPEPDRRERILFLLKTNGPRAAAWLAERLGITSMGVRQHLSRLEAEGLVRAAIAPAADGRTGSDRSRSSGRSRAKAAAGLGRSEGEPRRAGRPAKIWHLTGAAETRFPAAYAELALDLIEALRASQGDAAVGELVERRASRALAGYRARLPGARAPLSRRVAALTRLRSEEGYMGETRKEPDGSLLLIENHCPISAAAEKCRGLCTSELELFRACLGENVTVEREEHLLEGARRCVYRISPKSA